MLETTPSYNLKVIVRKTGIKPDTLRAWERRYGLPVPQRTAGGHRLYSQRDLDTVKWLMAREREGMRIGQAVQLWRDLEAGGQDPLHQPAVVGPPPGKRAVPAATLADLSALREAWVSACLSYDEAGAEQQLAHALARHAPELVSLELLQKGMSEIGRLWYENKATAQQEHFTSAIALRRINALLASPRPPTCRQTIYRQPSRETALPLLLTLLCAIAAGRPPSSVPTFRSRLEHVGAAAALSSWRRDLATARRWRWPAFCSRSRRLALAA